MRFSFKKKLYSSKILVGKNEYEFDTLCLPQKNNQIYGRADGVEIVNKNTNFFRQVCAVFVKNSQIVLQAYTRTVEEDKRLSVYVAFKYLLKSIPNR